ncbi:hypothetical protein PV325_009076 [Microctonus aethiopoides]|uniref:Uncharacterized protein n=1 Tax=Microctonus aethiopoides TaxID=144406 RepID=A0AA39KT55_9HYME|nr:hypothetical protein PV325_009076 [Microctonus aethiopoides]KAK0172782.1 hypothetical protein PV328_006057 [Microctonus aethiopoides]
MSICFRTLSCKLTSFVGQRHSIVQLDRRLTKLIGTSASFREDCNSSLKQIINDEVSLTSPTYKISSVLNKIGVKLYSTSPNLSKKPIETSVDDKYSKTDTNAHCNREDGPNNQQLEHIRNTLARDLPRFFCASIEYRIYRHDLEFINNYKGIITKGIHNYIKQVLYLRVSGHLLYAYIKFDVLKITIHPEENTVKVRWRIRGLSTLKVFSQFWKIKFTNLAQSIEQLETWHDGFSTYYVDSTGLVYKHVADKMMPDDETIPVKDKPNIASKLTA